MHIIYFTEKLHNNFILLVFDICLNILLSNTFVVYVLPVSRCVIFVLHLIWLSISLLQYPECAAEIKMNGGRRNPVIVTAVSSPSVASQVVGVACTSVPGRTGRGIRLTENGHSRLNRLLCVWPAESRRRRPPAASNART